MKHIILTHTDADGVFSATLLAKTLGEDTVIICADYHELETKQEEVITLLKENVDTIESVNITDLSVSSDFIIRVADMINWDGDVKVFDHHLPSLELESEIEHLNVTLHIDTARSATKIVYDTLYEVDGLVDLIDAVNAADIYRAGDIGFHSGLAISSMFKEDVLTINGDNYLNMEYRKELAETMVNDFTIASRIAKYVDASLAIAKSITLNRIAKTDDLNSTVARATIIAKEVYTVAEPFEINGNGTCVVLPSVPEQSLVSLLTFQNEDVDVALFVSERGTIAFRSKQGSEYDMNDLANTVCNGGGHFNAAGGKVDVSLDTHIEVIDYVQKIVENKL